VSTGKYFSTFLRDLLPPSSTSKQSKQINLRHKMGILYRQETTGVVRLACAVSEDVGGTCRRVKRMGKEVGFSVHNENHRVLGRDGQIMPWEVKCTWSGM
jgi:hypothetical protein